MLLARVWVSSGHDGHHERDVMVHTDMVDERDVMVHTDMVCTMAITNTAIMMIAMVTMVIMDTMNTTYGMVVNGHDEHDIWDGCKWTR